MNSFIQLATALNWTPVSVVLVLMSMFVVEGFRVLGRASAPNVQREPFKFGEWISQFANWFSIVLSLVCSMVLLVIRDSIVSSMGLDISDEGNFEYYFAVGAGAFGQAMMKVVLKAFMGMFGAFGRTQDSR